MRLIDAVKLKEKIAMSYEDLDAIFYCLETIDDAPTIDPVKHAYWEHLGSGYNFALICSECGCCSHTGFDYCPECGARMDGAK